LPQYFYVPFGSVDEERESPGSQHRVASNHGLANKDLHIWSQSMLIISDLLTSKLLNVYELDPIRRHLPSYHRPRARMQARYSAFEKGAGDVSYKSVCGVCCRTIKLLPRSISSSLYTLATSVSSSSSLSPSQIDLE
jgi:hypothetical protein